MRELKFRAWDTTRSIMVNVEELDFIGEEARVCDKEDNEEYYHFSWLKIMQYTGLKDKNDVEIYEGDILKCVEPLSYNHVYKFKGAVDFDNGSFLIDGGSARHYRWIDYEVEIIGNIYENPEILD